MLQEKWMQDLWSLGRGLPVESMTTCGIPLEILDPGTINRHAGPDFFNARIRMGALLWAGCVEIHRKASDWIRHGHHLDPAYDNVILHVVAEDDRIVFNNRGIRIPSLVLRLQNGLPLQQDPFSKASPFQNCRITALLRDPVHRQGMLNRLAIDAMEGKCSRVRSILVRCGQDWESALLMVMASSFGLPANRLPFEWTLSGIPQDLLDSYRDHHFVLEALLLGMAGFLEKGRDDGPYKKALQRHFHPFRTRLLLPPLPLHLWRFLQMRPPSFPTLRLAQFAALIHFRSPLLSSLLELESMAELELFLRTHASTYWNTHYRFEHPSKEYVKCSGQTFIHTLIINGVAPFLYTYGSLRSSRKHLERAIWLWQNLGPENNYITRFWAKQKMTATNALESQGLIHLYRHCIKQKHCFNCLLGIGKTDPLHE